MKKLFDFLAKLPVPTIPGVARDKVLHMFFGTFVYIVLIGYFWFSNGLDVNGILGSLMLTFGVAFAKEGYDWFSKTGTADGADVGATVMVPTILTIVIFIVRAII